MVINSTNMNKANNHLSSSMNAEHKKKDNGIYDVGTQGPGLEQVKKCGWVKPVNVNPIPLPSW